jgi:hypothetical protein
MKRARIRGIILGVALAIACHLVPAEYQTACETISQLAALGGCGV